MMLGELLHTVARELLALQHLSTDAQMVMSFALQQASLDAGQWSRAQALDLITQRLQGLETIASALARSMPPHWTIDPMETVRDVSLSGLVNRILSTPEPDAAAETIELF